MKKLNKILLGIFLFYVFYRFVMFSNKMIIRYNPPTIKYYDENLVEHTGLFNMKDQVCEALWNFGLKDKEYLPLKYVRICLLNQGV